MHASSPSHASAGPSCRPLLTSRSHPLSRSRGFSLVEVTLSIGIIAFAFVALLGLLPAGLTSFRAAIDSNNETRIVQSLIGKVQMTDFSQVPDLDFSVSNEVFYFDEEGTPTDTSVNPVQERETARLYAAKMFVRPASAKNTDDPTRYLNFTVDAIVVFANVASLGIKQLEELKAYEDLEAALNGKERLDVRVRPVLISKMDGFRP